MEPGIGKYQPPKVEIIRPREELPEAQVGAVVAAIGNHEGKALLNIAMRPGTTYDTMGLHNLWLEMQQGQDGWKGSSSNQFKWCKSSLAPIGIVTKKIIERRTGQTIGFEKTPFGFEQGDALAGHLLHFSLKDLEGSLYKYYGGTQSSRQKPEDTGAYGGVDAPDKNRSPLTRHRIFYELATADAPLREIDVAKSLSERYPQGYQGLEQSQGNLGQHLIQLSEHGLIQYEARSANTAFSTYIISADSPQKPPDPARGTIHTLTSQMHALFQRFPNEDWTHEKMAARLNQEYGKKYRSSVLSSTFGHLRKEGYISRGEFGDGKQSKISLTPQQQERLSGLVTIIDRFAEQDPAFLEEGREKAREIISDPSTVALLARKAQEASPNANRTDKADTLARIEAFIASHPGCTREDIRGALKDLHQQNITMGAANHHMREFAETGGLIITAQGKQHHYFLERRLSGEEIDVYKLKK